VKIKKWCKLARGLKAQRHTARAACTLHQVTDPDNAALKSCLVITGKRLSATNTVYILTFSACFPDLCLISVSELLIMWVHNRFSLTLTEDNFANIRQQMPIYVKNR
jgi:hypothetical protein